MESTINTIITTAHSCAKDGNLIIMFANKLFKSKVVMRADSLKKLGIDFYMIVALDTELEKELGAKKYNVCLYPLLVNKSPYTRKRLWITRTEIIKNIIESGLNVLNIDCDAEILKDPFPLILSTNTDIVSTPGTVWPTHIHKKNGFVLRCGFIFYRCTKNTIKFLTKFYNEVKTIGDDQIALNSLLDKLGFKWDLEQITSYSISFRTRRKTFLAFEDPIFGQTNDNLTVVMLQHKYFPRLTDPRGDPYVVDLIEK
jgi:hypothetical protein